MNVARISEFEDARALYGAAPISESAPAGADVRGDSEFEQLEAELRRMDSEGPSVVDWRKVSTVALGILSSRSKDILVASWATFALFRTEGVQGLAVGLGVLRGMVEGHWDAMHPPLRRERARVAALDWLVGRVAPQVAEVSLSDADHPAVLAAYDALDDLERLLGEKLQKEQVALGELFRALRPHRDEAKRALQAAAERAAEVTRQAEQAEHAARDQAPAPAPPDAAPAAAAPVPAAAPASAPAAVAAPVLDGDHASTVQRLPEILRPTAAALRATAPADPRAYLLNRIGSWLRFDALPSDNGGQTMVHAPADAIAALAAKAGQHADVVALAEDLVWTAPFWLDSHRHAYQALDQLGMKPAAAAVRAAVALLTTRFPTILSLSFTDGTPFADDETRVWASQGGGGGAPARDPVEIAVADAHKQMAGGDLRGAFGTLARLLDRAEGARGRFVGQLAQAAFCLDRGFVTTALPLLDHLDTVVVERRLEDWEPAVALRVAELRFRAITHSDAQQMLDDTRRRAALEQIRARIARLDIGLASRLGR